LSVLKLTDIIFVPDGKTPKISFVFL